MTESACPAAPWILRTADDAIVARLAALTGLSPVTCRILASRGIVEPDDLERFLSPSLDAQWLPPSLVPGMDAVAERVVSAIASGERIAVFGDFDLDGISAAATAARGLRELGADVVAFVPRRFDEGYGLSEAAIERMMSAEPRLVVTVDCGISAGAEVDSLLARGVDVAITDHHEPSDAVPAHVPVADPKLDPESPCQALAGAGVALKLVHAVGERLGRADVWRDLIDLATLGTVADIVPLIGENRALVAEGVQLMRAGLRPGIAALAQVAGVELAALTSESIAFGLAPRLNAPGRMADPAASLELLMTDDPDRARELAAVLDEHNRVRQAAEAELAQAALEQVAADTRRQRRAVVVAGDGWHEGVKGIVASRVTSATGLPSIVFSIEDGVARGSGRSVGTVDLFRAISSCSDLLERYGGHAGAVGLTLPAERIPVFRDRLEACLADVPEAAFAEAASADAVLELSDASIELVAEFDQLAPFGHANPKPTFASCGVFMNSRQRVGKDASHLRFTAYDGASSVQAIAFRMRDIERLCEHEAPVDLLYELEANEWRGVTRLQMLVRDVHEPLVSAHAGAPELVEELFAHADATLAREEYHGIEEAPAFHTKLAGVSFEGRQDLIGQLAEGTPLRVERRPDNPYDENACALVDPRGHDVGWFNRRLAAVLAPALDAGVAYDVTVTEVTGGADGKALGVNVVVERRDDAAEAAAQAQARLDRRAELESLTGDELDAQLVREFIGEGRLHDAQVRALASLAEGHSTLVVMATGRGKSLIFHLHAARTALTERRASVFVFPLRALVADQAFHLERVFSRVGLSVRTVTGESSTAQRDTAFSELAEGALDVILTTPEFLEFHAPRFAESGRVGFLVVDEAHHVGMARASHRPAYMRLRDALARLGGPTVLAVTATADDDVAATIVESLGIAQVVLDPTVRENLLIDDRRDHPDRDSYLVALAARGEKAIVYVNSRDQSVRIAKMLRKKLPDRAAGVAFYNGGMTRSMRNAVEHAFREGDLQLVVSTSAFGEGVNIPDVRHVVLYHLPFNDVEFNQMCGRAGRDGAPSHVHLVFGGKDARINELILGSMAPSRDDMAALYVVLRDAQNAEGPGFEVTNAELADRARKVRREFCLDERGVSSALGVFRELGLLDGEGSGAYRRLTLCPAPDGKVDLASSVRYAEGLDELEGFKEFRGFALGAEAQTLLERFNRPILPTRTAGPV